MAITDPLNRVTRLAYDDAGRVVRQTQPDGTEIAFAYDDAGNMVGVTPPGRPQHKFTFDEKNRLTQSTPPPLGPTDDSTRYVYNLAHQLVRENLPGGEVIAYAYCGRLTGITTPWGQYDYTYSTTTGQLSSLASPGGFTLSFSYDGGQVTSEALSGPVARQIGRIFDNNFRVFGETINGGNRVDFACDGDGLLTQAGDFVLTRDPETGRVTDTKLAIVTDAVGYNEFGEARLYQVQINATQRLQLEYTRDSLGRITRKVETLDGNTKTTDYGYDLNGQLETVTEDGVLVQRFRYDPNGNRLSLETPAGTVTGAYDDQDRVLRYGTKVYAYDTNGAWQQVTDLATGQVTRYTNDAFENLTQVELPDGRVIEYLIDGQNRRIGKKVNGTLTEGFLYDGQLRPVAKLDASGTIVERFVYATGVNVPAYLVKDGVAYRLVTDHLGSVRLVVNAATGAIAQHLDYDAFGRVLQDTNPGFQPFGFAGGLYDSDTRLVRFGARDYDAESGRWTAKDPIGLSGSVNVFQYTQNNPMNITDRTGLYPGDEERRSGTPREAAGKILSLYPEANKFRKNPYKYAIEKRNESLRDQILRQMREEQRHGGTSMCDQDEDDAYTIPHSPQPDWFDEEEPTPTPKPTSKPTPFYDPLQHVDDRLQK